MFPTYAVMVQDIQAQQDSEGAMDTPADPDDFERIHKAAEDGDIHAQYLMGRAYFQGKGVPRDYKEAGKWFRKAAEKGDPSAQYMLGEMYVEGLGLAKDYTQAYMWLTMSIAGSEKTQDQLIKKANDLRNSIAGKMTPQQIAEAGWMADQGTDEQAKDGRIYNYGGIDSDPVALYRPNPSYTEKARKARVEGVIVLECIIRKTGNVDSCKIIRGLGFGLDESAIRTIESEWLFQPGAHKGIPVDVKANFETQFKIF